MKLLLELTTLLELKDVHELDVAKQHITTRAQSCGFADVYIVPHFGQDRLLGTQQGATLSSVKKAIDDLFNRNKKVVRNWIDEAWERDVAGHASKDFQMLYNNAKRGCGFSFAIRFMPDADGKSTRERPQLRCLTFYHGRMKGNGENDVHFDL